LNWSIIIFCYNEAGSLADTVTRCHDFLRLSASAFEIIIVNDGSIDKTRHVCDALTETYNSVKVINHATNLGIGAALKTGYRKARFQYVCAVPGDGQFDPRELTLVKPFELDVFYSFYRKKNDYNLYRKGLTVFNKLYNRLLLGINLQDVNWIKVYRREQLNFVDIQLNSSILESEICAKLIKSGSVAIEIPSVYQKRTSGEPKGGSWKTLKKAISETWLLFWAVKNFKTQIREVAGTVSVFYNER
jgi:glycosyltransferase involved in cell wall biosynthesis